MRGTFSRREPEMCPSCLWAKKAELCTREIVPLGSETAPWLTLFISKGRSLNLHLCCHVSSDLCLCPAYSLVHTSLSVGLWSVSGLEGTKRGKPSTERGTGSSFCSALTEGTSTAGAVQLAGEHGVKRCSLLTTA